MSRVKIAPSILSADFTRLGEHIREAEQAGADWIHVDVMDGHFVPNITIGPLIAAAARRATTLPIDVHLMIERPERYLADFAEAGANYLTVHRTIQQIRELGVKPGVTLNPGTSVDTLAEVLPYVDLVLVMSVNPGFGGQSYIPTSTDKIARIRRMLDERGLNHVELQVDGGVAPDTAEEVVRAGATCVVAGSAVYNTKASVEENVRRLREVMDAAGGRGRA
jgi:ribulose-phosphate 3-epimerase